MTFIHIADLHCNKERKEWCLNALQQIKNYIILNPNTKLLIAGDFWDYTITATSNSGFPEFINAIKSIVDITDVYMITGTPFHEPAGSCDIFNTLGVKLFKYNSFVDMGDFELVAMPEPRKQDFISSNNIDKAIQKSYIDFIEGELPSKTKPRIAMIHNEIRSAVLQNGVPVDETHATAIPSKLLKKINADYYACGHIHEPQKVESVGECYYAGSVYPKDFGESHDAGFYVINIEDKIKIERHSFGFPINRTFSTEIENINNYKNYDFTNQNVKLLVKIDKLFKKNYSKESLEKEIKESTNANSIKIQFAYNKEESRRSQEVATKEDIVEKFKAYAAINNIKLTDSLINKVEIIKDNLSLTSFIPNDSYELEYISVRGAIGLKDGSNLDEIEINFTDYNNGILCLLGANGSGKSTLIENCSPYPHMLTRSGSLKDNFCLKDSHRILIYKTSNGKRIRITMQIDGVAKSIGTRYFVEEKEPDGEWKPNPSVDGSNDSYMNYVNTHFGDVSLFLRTSFYAKKQIKTVPDLALATKSEKMTLFSTLAGTDYLSEVSDMAKQNMKDIKKGIDDIKGQLAGFDDISERISTYTQDIKDNNEKLEELNAYIKLDKEELEIYKEEQKKYDAAIASVQFIHKEIASKNNELDNLQRDINMYQSNVDELKEQLSDIDTYKADAKWYEESTETRKNLTLERIKLKNEYNELSRIYTELLQKKEVIKESINKNRESYIKIEANIKSATKALVKDNSICPTCGQPLNQHKKDELIAEQDKIKKDINEMTKCLEELKSKDTKFREDINALGINEHEEKINIITKNINSIDNDINQIDTYMEEIDIGEIKNILENTEPLLKDNEKRLKSFKDKFIEVQKSLIELEDKANNLPEDYSDKIKRLERGIVDSNEKISTINAEIKVLNDNLISLKQYEEQIKDIDSKISDKNRDLKDYDIIMNAFGNNGIQAYELDNIAPEIADITNDILQECYGDRFKVSFDTQRDAADGRKIDDFIINVFDSVSGREKNLSLLSSGESVWIKQALYFAFSVMRTKKTGFCFRTRFLDESDGELDTGSRPKFVKMVETAHKLCNATLTILITHSIEVKDLLEQKIELNSRAIS